MIFVSNSISIACSNEKVFQFFSKMENLPKWNYYILSVKRVSPNEGIGAIYHQVRRKDQQHFQIIDLKPDKLISIETTKGTKPYVLRNTHFSYDKSSTHLVDEIKINTLFPSFIEFFARKKIEKAVKKNLLKMKELLETGSTTLQDGRKTYLA